MLMPSLTIMMVLVAGKLSQGNHLVLACKHFAENGHFSYVYVCVQDSCTLKFEVLAQVLERDVQSHSSSCSYFARCCRFLARLLQVLQILQGNGQTMCEFLAVMG